MHIPFNSSPRASVGVEWELELVDRNTRQLRGRATEILEELGDGAGGSGEHPKAKHELMESTVEVITGVCDTIGQAKADLAGTVAELSALAERRGLGLICSGTHPFTDYGTQRISPSERYAQLADRMQWLVRRLQIFGVHVHVGVRSADKAIPIINALTAYLPHFLALSASSPYWLGSDTGLASARSKVFESLPSAGPPQRFADWAAFEDFAAAMTRSGTIESIREIWWDIRPHPNFGTVELRAFDGLPTLLEIGAVAALSQCLVHAMDGRLDAGHELPVPPDWMMRENKWRAARYGLDADILTDSSGSTRSLREEVIDLVDWLGPVAAELDCGDELRDALKIVAAGPSYVRQRAAARRADGKLEAVVDTLLEEMSSGRPLTA